MKEEKVLEFLIKRKGVNKGIIKELLTNKQKGEDIVSFFIRVGLISYEDLNELAEFIFSQSHTDKKLLEKHGIIFEDFYFRYTKEDGSLYIVPYLHVRLIEKRQNVVNIYAGGVERLSVKLDSEESAEVLVEVLLLHINKVFLQKHHI